MDANVRKRDIRVDALRAVCILLIILAHTGLKGADDTLFQLRTFDVPGMAICLGMSCELSSGGDRGYLNYVGRRFMRLIVPMWIFLTIYFAVYGTVVWINGESFFGGGRGAFEKVLWSYIPMSGIGYVWIIRIYFMISLMIPVLMCVKKIRGIFPRLIYLFLLFIMQNCLCRYCDTLEGTARTLFSSLVVMTIGYAIMALCGMWMVRQTVGDNVLMALMGVAFYVSYALVGGMGFLDMQNNKYPPNAYFLGYGLFIGAVIFIVSGMVLTGTDGVPARTTRWLSVHSMGLYYVHIVLLIFADRLMPDSGQWPVKYVTLLIGSVIVVWLMNLLIPLVKGMFCRADSNML